jgi:hypothetical protein
MTATHPTKTLILKGTSIVNYWFSIKFSLITVANWIGHILHRNCLLKQITEGKIKGQIEVTRRRGRRRKKVLDDLKDRRGYCQLKEEALDRTMWRNRFGRGFGPVVWQITDDDDDSSFIASDFWQAHGAQGEKIKDGKSKSGSTLIKTLD